MNSMLCKRIEELLEENRLLALGNKDLEERLETMISGYRKVNNMFIDTSEVNRNLKADNRYLEKEVNELNATVCLLENRLERSSIWLRIRYAATGYLGSYK